METCLRSFLAQGHFQRPLSGNTVHRAIHQCRLKLYHAERKPYLDIIQKHGCTLGPIAHLKMIWGKVENCSVVRQLEIWNFLWDVMDTAPSGLKRRDPVRFVISTRLEKPAPLTEWRYVRAYGTGNLHIWKGTFNAKPHSASITTAWLRSRRVRVRICLQPRPFTDSKYLAHHEMKNMTKKTQGCWSARIL